MARFHTSFAVAVVAAACLVAAGAFPITIDVNIDGRVAPLTLHADADPLSTVLAFVSKEGLSEESVGPIIAALEREAQAAMPQGAAPVVSFPVNVQGVRHQLEYYAGDIPEDTVRRFLVERGVGNDPAIERYVASLAGEVRRGLSGLQGQAGAPPPPSTIATVSVELDGNLYPLDVHEGETPEAAAAKFASDLRLGTDSIGVLTQAIQRKVAEQRAQEAQARTAGGEAPLFVLPVFIDDVAREVKFFAGEDPALVANRFCIESGVADPVGCDSVRAALQARLAAVTAPALQTVSVLVGGTAYDLEYDPARSDATDLARQFCTQEWDAMYAALRNDLGTAEVTANDCVAVLGQLLASQVRGTV